MWTTETLERASNTLAIVKYDGTVRGSVQFHVSAVSSRLVEPNEEEVEALKTFIALIERMNDEQSD